MLSLTKVTPRITSVLATLLVGMTMLAFIGEASAGTHKLTGNKFTSNQIAAACALAGGQYSRPSQAEYGCKTSKGEVECVGNECWGTCEKCGARVIGPNVKGVLGRPSGIALTRRSARRQSYAQTYCQWCYASCGRWNYICKIHCQTRVGCPPLRDIVATSRG